MGGNRAGGLKAAAKNKAKYGDDFYVNIGRKSSENWKRKPVEERPPRGLGYIKVHDPERFKAISAKGGHNGKGGGRPKKSE